jgi:hypothetical protein
MMTVLFERSITLVEDKRWKEDTLPLASDKGYNMAEKHHGRTSSQSPSLSHHSSIKQDTSPDDDGSSGISSKPPSNQIDQILSVHHTKNKKDKKNKDLFDFCKERRSHQLSRLKRHVDMHKI